ncbi:MAG: pyrF [Methylocystaceae bacterium]|nr:MAG: pyrF [Methylocystaceae bacterium]
MKPQDRLIVALDVESVEEARAMVAALGETVSFFKVGMELAYAPGGFDFARELKAAGKRVFLDLKLHDIGVTVERATRQIARLGVDFLTIHAFPQTMAAAREGASGSALKLLAVTVMTSYDDADLKEAGYACGVAELVARRARQAREKGVDGLILSPMELGAIRPLVGEGMLLVTPGVRPEQAVAASADYIVVGRPITRAADPAAAAKAMVGEMAGA